MTTTLLASSPTIEGIGECIEKFYCGTKMELLVLPYRAAVPEAWGVRRVSDGKVLDRVRVVKSKGRYRFEMVLEASK